MQTESTATARICPQCKEPFWRQPSLPFRFCSPECYRASRVRPVEERFWERVNRRGPEECWLWSGSQNGRGYGHMSVVGRGHVKTHRLSYEINVGPIPEGLLVRHRCERTLCANPAHLMLGNHSQNLYDRYRLGRAMTKDARPQPARPLRARVEQPCQRCGLFYFPRNAKQRYCSTDCSVKARYGESDIDRFWAKVNKTGECWLWTAAQHEYGYGLTAFRGTQTSAHRVAWIITHGPLTPDIVVCHNCPGGDNPQSVRPSHMFLGTKADNARDCSRKGRVQQGDGHFTRRHPELRVCGERVGGCKLTSGTVRDIRARAAAGETQQEIAAALGVSQTNVGMIVRRITWKHVD